MATIYIYRDIIYMNATVNGKQIRRSTGLKNTKNNLKFVKKELLEKFDEEVNRDETYDVKLSYYIKKFKQEKKYILKERTYQRYCQMIDRWISPKYGRLKVKEIKISTLKGFLNDHFDEGKSVKTVELYRTVFNGVLQEAVYDGVINDNPFKNIKRPKKKKTKIMPFSANEVRLLLENTNGWFRNYIGIATTLGLRSGELLGLKWIDIKENEILIQRTRDFNRDTTPKTESSKRNLPIFKSVKGYLESQKEITGHLEYVFTRPNELPWSDTQWIAQLHWYPLLDKLGLKRRRLYEMRHTFATNMLNSGHFKVTEIARMLGHTTTEYLFNVYSAYIESEKNNFPLDIDIYS